MEEKFFININCSEILVDSDETRYTMHIDSSKMSIVFEVVEWIRWMFSVENCVYLTHESSVIHELEDIQVLSKLKNFEIKPCGQFQCVHTKTYRTLLNSFSFFVSWNETKVPKYFLDKINLMNHKLAFENNNFFKNTVIKSFLENDTCENNKKTDSPDSSYFNEPLQKSTLEDSVYTKKRALLDNFEKESNGTSLKEFNNHFNESFKSKKKCASFFEDNRFTNGVDSLNEAETKKCISIASVNNFLKNGAKISENVAKFKTEKKFTKFRPFSVGEILSSMRERLEKANAETSTYKNTSLCKEENLDVPMTTLSEDLSNKNDEIESLKRKRIRRRKRPKKKNSEEMDLASPLLDSVSVFNSPNSSSNFKPNHIRFDINEENDITETEHNNDILKLPNNYLYENLKLQIQNKTSFKTEAGNLNIDKNNIFKGTDSQLCNSLEKNDTEMEFSGVHNQMNNEEKVVDLNDPGCGYSNPADNFQQSSSSKDLIMLDSLKDKFKNAVVVERFY